MPSPSTLLEGLSLSTLNNMSLAVIWHIMFGAAIIGLIAGGAVGNLIDRLRFGSVVDFLDFYVGDYHWPAFNVADSAITIGVGLFILGSMLAPPAECETKERQE